MTLEEKSEDLKKQTKLILTLGNKAEVIINFFFTKPFLCFHEQLSSNLPRTFENS